LGGASNDRALGTVIDSAGDVIVAGYSDAPSGFVTKRAAADGSERWTLTFNATNPGALIELRGIALGPDDSVLVTGDYGGTVDFGGQTLMVNESGPPTRGDMFLAKYLRDGQLLWVKGLSSTADARGLTISADHGQIIVAGEFDGPLDLGGQQLTPANGNNDCFVAAFDSAGQLLGGNAIHATGSNTTVTPTAAAITPTGAVLVTGSFSSPVTLGSFAVSPDAADRAFLARFGPDARPQSIQALGVAAPGQSYATHIAAGTDEFVVQTLESDTAGTPTAYGRVYAFDMGGTPTWSARIDDDGLANPQIRTLAIAPDDVVTSAAWVDGPYSVDRPDTATGTMEVATFDPTGTRSTSSFGKRMVGAPVETMVGGSAIGPSGASSFVGDFAGALDFGAGPMLSHGRMDSDVFVVLVDPPRQL
jgi:hypothetical protein